jgi:hypothetical protein
MTGDDGLCCSRTGQMLLDKALIGPAGEAALRQGMQDA